MKQYKRFWRAVFETRHFTFEAYGSTRVEAIATLKLGWIKHCLQAGADLEYINEYEDDIDAYEVELMSCYRDRENNYPLIQHAIYGD